MGKKLKKSQFSRNFIIAAIIMFILLVIIQTPQPVACTEEAKICPDGSDVGRIPPNCDFALCPSEINCSLFSADNCPSLCVVCPPCEACSSISCQTEEFCKSIGFDRSWWESVHPKSICKCPAGYVQEGDVCNPVCYYSIPKCLMPSIMCSTSCESDSDCVGTECCHPTSCINKAYKEDCSNIGCSAVCEGPLDCGAGTCGCVNNRCVVIPR